MFDTYNLLLSSGTLLLILLGGYVYMAAILMVLARKTGVPDGWWAWVPILNLVLMCRIAKKPGALAILFFVPLVNLVALVIVWMAIARVRGRPPALGILMIVPLLNLVIPLVLAGGPGVQPQAGAVRSSVAVCPACGRTECVGEKFCGYTGQFIEGTAMPAAAPLTAPAAQAQPGVLAKVILGVILAVGVAYLGFGLFSSGGRLLSRSSGSTSTRQGTTAALPPRIAGTLTEFPVDTAAAPARPTSVRTTNFRAATTAGGSSQAAAAVPAQSLPPGLPVSAIGQVAESMTSATYQTQPSDPPVDVHVISTAPGMDPQPRTLAEGVAAASADAELKGVEVRSPDADSYSGYRVRTPRNVAYILRKAGAAVLLVIWARDPAVKEIADRLATNVGNGNGLHDDPELSASLATLPSQLPPGLELSENNMYTGTGLEQSLEELKRAMNADFGPEAQQWVERARSIMPPRLTSAKYLDSTRREFKLVVGDYGGSAKAWTMWQLLRSTLGVSSMRSISLNGGDALSAVDSGIEYIVFRRGGCLGLVAGPNDQTGRTVRLAETVSQ